MVLERKLGLGTATLVVIASMIGTGIFVTTGEILGMTQNSFVVLILWFVGGLIAVSGTMAYAELSAMMPEVGGEYLFLRNIFGLLPAFLTGWISLIVGFSASIASSALAFSTYLTKLAFSNHWVFLAELLKEPWLPKAIAIFLIVFFGIIHALGVEEGSRIQNVLTVIKFSVVVLFVFIGIFFIDYSRIDRLFTNHHPSGTLPDLPTMSLSLLIIMWAFSGWNGATYIAGEIKDPEKNLPKALFLGTVLTTFFYIALNVIFLLSSDYDAIKGQKAVGEVAATHLFGKNISSIFTGGILLILLSSISVQMMIGPRVYYAMARDNVIFKELAIVSKRFQTPIFAIMVQTFISVLYVLFVNLEWLMVYMGFSLSVFPVLTVIGLMYMRHKFPEKARPHSVPLYPWLPLFFILMSIVMMATALMKWTESSQFALLVLFSGIPVFYLWRWIIQNFSKKNPPQ